MKKNKILLGAALLAFAVGSAFVTKAANQKQLTAVWYINPNTGQCDETTTAKNCQNLGGGCTDIVGSFGSLQLYQDDQCLNALRP